MYTWYAKSMCTNIKILLNIFMLLKPTKKNTERRNKSGREYAHFDCTLDTFRSRSRRIVVRFIFLYFFLFLLVSFVFDRLPFHIYLLILILWRNDSCIIWIILNKYHKFIGIKWLARIISGIIIFDIFIMIWWHLGIAVLNVKCTIADVWNARMVLACHSFIHSFIQLCLWFSLFSTLTLHLITWSSEMNQLAI